MLTTKVKPINRLAISDNRPRPQEYYAALNRKGERHWVTRDEEWRICVLFDAGLGVYCSTIAARVFGNGNPRYVPSDAEVACVGKVLRLNNRRISDWRKGVHPQVKARLSGVLRENKLKIA
jgi:hypothetical protein